jgi:hypothetical protein
MKYTLIRSPKGTIMNIQALSKWSKEKRKLKEFWFDKDGVYGSDCYLRAISRMAERYIKKYPNSYSIVDGIGTPVYILAVQNE